MFKGYGPKTTNGVYVMNADGTGVQRLADIRTTAQGLWVPSWTTDGSAILVSALAVDARSYDLWRLPVGGDDPVQLTANAEDEWVPVVGPDGRIAVIQGVNAPQLAIAAPDGTGLQVVPTAPLGRWSPVWSPDGSRILVNLADHTGLLIVEADGGAEPILVPADGPDGGGGWQPLPG